MPVFGTDGRTAMLADYERVSGLEGWPGEASRLFPPNQRVYVARVTQRQAKQMADSILSVGDLTFAVFPSYDAMPQELRERSAWAVRHHESIRAQPGFGSITGLPTLRIGATPAFDAMMSGGGNGLDYFFRWIQRTLESTERAAATQAAAGGDAGLHQ